MAVLDLNVGGIRMRARVSDGTVVREGEFCISARWTVTCTCLMLSPGSELEDPRTFMKNVVFAANGSSSLVTNVKGDSYGASR